MSFHENISVTHTVLMRYTYSRKTEKWHGEEAYYIRPAKITIQFLK